MNDITQNKIDLFESARDSAQTVDDPECKLMYISVINAVEEIVVNNDNMVAIGANDWSRALGTPSHKHAFNIIKHYEDSTRRPQKVYITFVLKSELKVVLVNLAGHKFYTIHMDIGISHERLTEYLTNVFNTLEETIHNAKTRTRLC